MTCVIQDMVCLFAGVIAYADDISILSCSCYGLQTLLDICSVYGQNGIRFNSVTSHQLMTFGGSNPDKTTVYLDRKIVQWCTKVKYLGLYLIGGADFKIDLTAARRKYYGCFMDVLILLCLLLEIKLTKLWLCILLNHIACHSSCMDVKFGH